MNDDGTRSKVSGHGGFLAARCLKNHGVEKLFSLSGGHLFSLYDGCVQEKIELVDVRHEQTAVFAAEGYAKVSRRVGVSALTAGPGVTNGISAIASAHYAGSPVVVVGGRAPGARWGQGSLQELDHVPLVESVTRWAGTSLTTDSIPSDLGRAISRATRPHRGPTFLDVPLDLFFAPAEIDDPRPDEEVVLLPDGDAVQAVAVMVSQAQRPVLMAGTDVYWGRAEGALQALAEQAEMPVFLNGLGRGCLAADHPLFFSRCRKTAFSSSDLVVVVGTPLDFRLGFGKFGAAKVVHLMDTQDRIAKHVDLAAGVSGSLREILNGIANTVGANDGRSDWLATLRAEEEGKRAEELAILGCKDSPIHPGRIYGELQKCLARDAIVIGDGGDFVSYAGKYVETFEPGCFLDPGPFGCLGTGPGYALGAATAFPDRDIVLLLGDGAAGFSMGDWDTLIRFGANVTIVVGNNHCWGLEKHPMQQIFGYHVAAELSPNARYDRVFEGLGGAAELVEEPAAIGDALRRGLDHAGPYLVNILTDPSNVYPRSSNLG